MSRPRFAPAALVSLACVACAALAPTVARADESPRAWSDEPPAHGREGFLMGFALGPGLTVGEARGAAGLFSLRVGTSAGDRLLWVLQLDSFTSPQTYTEMAGGEDKTGAETASSLVVAGQYYLAPVAWVKLGGGFSSLVRRDEANAALGAEGGLAAMAGGGYDLVRTGPFALGLEMTLAAHTTRVLTWGVGLGFTWY